MMNSRDVARQITQACAVERHAKPRGYSPGWYAVVIVCGCLAVALAIATGPAA